MRAVDLDNRHGVAGVTRSYNASLHTTPGLAGARHARDRPR